MAAGEGTVTSLDGDKRQFEQALTRALRSRGNLLTLAKYAEQFKLKVVEQRAWELVAGESVVTDIDRGKALWDLLGEAIDRLRPANAEPEPTPAWRLYAIVKGIYIQGKSTKEMAAKLGISERTFHRERRAAVEALATVIWQIEQRMRSLNATG
jgi:hypothetical protein